MSADRDEAIRSFLEMSGWGTAELVPLAGDASTRRYVRLMQNSRRAVLMDQPQDVEMPPCPAGATDAERRALGYNAVARLAGADCARFVAAAEYLRSRGLSAPEIYAADTAKGFALIEDLGDDLYAEALAQGADERELYAAAVDAIALLHAERAPAQLAPGLSLHAYDEAALLAEIDLMSQWFMPVALGREAAEDEVAEHRSLWRAALAPVLSGPCVFVHRDYHAQNLFWLPARRGTARVGAIDFQDAVAGNRSYDVISLVEDARRDVSAELANAMMQRYLAAVNAQGHALDAETWRTQTAVMAAQRNAKIAGIFARLHKRDGKPRYLGYLARVWGYFERDLAHPALAPLRAWYDRAIPRAVRGAPKRQGADA